MTFTQKSEGYVVYPLKALTQLLRHVNSKQVSRIKKKKKIKDEDHLQFTDNQRLYATKRFFFFFFCAILLFLNPFNPFTPVIPIVQPNLVLFFSQVQNNPRETHSR